MPFLEILSVRTSEARRRELCARVTEAIVKTLNISSDIVTIYVHDFDNDLYSHRGILGYEERCRIFIKVYALSRDVESRRRLAEALNLAVSCTLEWPEEDIAIYFIEREQSEVAHAGILQSDDPSKNDRDNVA